MIFDVEAKNKKKQKRRRKLQYKETQRFVLLSTFDVPEIDTFRRSMSAFGKKETLRPEIGSGSVIDCARTSTGFALSPNFGVNSSGNSTDCAKRDDSKREKIVQCTLERKRSDFFLALFDRLLFARLL